MTSREKAGSRGASKERRFFNSAALERFRRELSQILELSADKIFKRHDPGEASYRLKRFFLSGPKTRKLIASAEADLAAELYVLTHESLSDQNLKNYIASGDSRLSALDLAGKSVNKDMPGERDSGGDGQVESQSTQDLIVRFVEYLSDAGSQQSPSPESISFHSVLSISDTWCTVKWFDPIERRGILTSDEGGERIHLDDALLFGSRKPLLVGEGARVHCQVMRRGGRFEAIRIWDLAGAGPAPAAGSMRRNASPVRATSRWQRVKVKWYNADRGFGFLTRGQGTPDIFVHIDTVRSHGFAELKPGQMVEVRYGSGPQGDTAAALRPYARAGGAK